MNTGGCFLLFFGLFWSAITLGFDGFLGRTVYQRLHAESFATTRGVVMHSELIRSRGSKGGTNYRPKIHFAYAVLGREFNGEQFHYGDMSGNDPRWAERMLKEFPLGKSVTVHYDAENPADAVLLTGLEGSELFLAIFLTPFNCVMLALWSVPLTALQRRLVRQVAGVPLTQRFGRTHACLATVTPLVAALITLGGTAFATIFIVGFTAGFNPSVRVASFAWVGIFSAAVVAFALRWQRLSTGRCDLVLDLAARTLTLPRAGGFRESAQVPYADVKSITVERIAHQGQKGGTTYSHAPTLHLRDNRTERVADWYDEKKATLFAAWLRAQLGLPAVTAG